MIDELLGTNDDVNTVIKLARKQDRVFFKIYRYRSIEYFENIISIDTSPTSNNVTSKSETSSILNYLCKEYTAQFFVKYQLYYYSIRLPLIEV